jgi:phosphotransferase system, EIIB
MKAWTQIPTWGIIVIIIGVVFILATIAFIILLKRYLKRKKEFLEEQKVIDSYYKNIIDAVGKIQNIEKVEQVGSRLSFYLKDQSLLQVEALKEIHITGIVKTSKKVTLVVGEMAAKYAQFIQEEIKNQEV